MLLKQTEDKIKNAYRDYVNEKWSHLSKQTISSYYNESFSIQTNDRGVDIWDALGDEMKMAKAKQTITDFWLLWTEIYSESVNATNHHNAIAGAERFNEYIVNSDFDIELIKQENKNTSEEVVEIIVSNYDSASNEEILEKLVNLTNQKEDLLEVYINNYSYLLNDLDSIVNLSNDTLYLFLDKLEGQRLDIALIRVKEYLKYRFEVKLHQYPSRYEELDKYAKSRGSDVSFSKKEIAEYAIKIEFDISNNFYLLFDEVTDSEYEIEYVNKGTYINDDKKLMTRIKNIPVGAVFVLVNRVQIDDELSKYFDKGMFVYAKGTVIKNDNNGKVIHIKWEKEMINKLWYHDSYKNDFFLVKDRSWSKQAFIDFIMSEQAQDLDRYISEYGKKTNKVDKVLEMDSNLEDDEVENTYTKADFLEDVFIEEKEYNIISNLLTTKRNLILQGAPGVGKTYMAKRLAYSRNNEINNTYVQQVQFHQSYGYEDLIMGYKPTENHFELKNGPFYEFCKLAEENKDKDFYFIIDEINRGNISKIFGELLMLIEADKRGPDNSIRLMYSDEEFFVPKNVFIIGMMNTADRSLAVIDYALRRRFAFYYLKPAFNNKKFIQVLDNTNNRNIKKLVEAIKELNEEIINDEGLGKGFEIGHSYFTKENPIEDFNVSNILEYEIIPLVEEYWYDNANKIETIIRNLRASING